MKISVCNDILMVKNFVGSNMEVLEVLVKEMCGDYVVVIMNQYQKIIAEGWLPIIFFTGRFVVP